MFDINDCIVYITCSHSKVIGDVLNEKIMEYGISKSQWYALYYLGLDDKLSVCELANKMQVKHSSATRLLSRMEEDGFIVRLKDDVDKRITYLKLTDKAIDIRNKILPLCERISEAAVNNIEDEKIGTYKEVLEQLTKNVIEHK